MVLKKAAAPFIGMTMAECAQAGLIILSKLAMSDGISSLVFVLYSNAIAALVLLPISLLVHRSSSRPPLTFSILCGFFLLGVLGCAAQVSGYAGINLSSPTLGTALLNLTPGFTFVLAVIFRMERLVTRSSLTVAKSIGTIVSIAGALMVTLYKGPSILGVNLGLNLSGDLVVASQHSNWVLGGCLLFVDCIITASWLILQVYLKYAFVRLYRKSLVSLGSFYEHIIMFFVSLFSHFRHHESLKEWFWMNRRKNKNKKFDGNYSKIRVTEMRSAELFLLLSGHLISQALVLKKYSAELVVVFFYCFFVVILSAVICFIVETDLEKWSLNSSIRLYSVIYSGIFGSAFQVGVGTWCLHQTGPVFVAMFKPLGIIITVAVGVIFLGETFYIGSLMGSVVIVIGFYSVMWGKAKEAKEINNGGENSASSSQKVRLLGNDSDENVVC